MPGHVKLNRFVVNERGKPEAVTLSLTEYRKLLCLIEDREDSIALKKATQTRRGTISHSRLLERLKSIQKINIVQVV